MRFRVTVQIERGVRDDIGGFTTSWHNIMDRWADVVPVGSGESLDVRQVTGNITHRVFMRMFGEAEIIYAAAILAGYDTVDEIHDINTIADTIEAATNALTPFTSNVVATIDTTQSEEPTAPLFRLLFRGRVLHVTGIEVMGNRNEWMELFCREET